MTCNENEIRSSVRIAKRCTSCLILHFRQWIQKGTIAEITAGAQTSTCLDKHDHLTRISDLIVCNIYICCSCSFNVHSRLWSTLHQNWWLDALKPVVLSPQLLTPLPWVCPPRQMHMEYGSGGTWNSQRS